MTKQILILGAGRSSYSLITYLNTTCSASGWELVVGDLSEESARRMTAGLSATPIRFDIRDTEAAGATISRASLVVSLLPPHLHPDVAEWCLKHRKHLVTASYVSDALRSFDAAARDYGLIFLNECGLDPGIDHMSAMQVMDRIRAGGGKITGFRSFTGGLIAPETDPENPWRYKFTWNSRNVVTAGQGGATYLDGGKICRVPYHYLFKRVFPFDTSLRSGSGQEPFHTSTPSGSGKEPFDTSTRSGSGQARFDGYANRDSLKYIALYGLEGISTMIRGTLRYHGFCQSWDALVQLGCCDDTQTIDNTATLTHAEFIEQWLPPGKGSVEDRFRRFFNFHPESTEMEMLQWSGFFSDEPIGLQAGTSAAVVEHILNKRWKMNRGDKDMIVMWHQFLYESDGKRKEIQSSLIAVGEDDIRTAMAKTVGLPLAMAARLIMEGKIRATGVCIPTTPEFYDPILAELSQYGITLEENHIS